MSALIELRGLSLMTMKICSSFSRLMKLPNQDFLASLWGKKRHLAEYKPNVVHIHLYTADHFCNLVLVPYQSIDSEKQPPPHSSVGIQRSKQRMFQCIVYEWIWGGWGEITESLWTEGAEVDEFTIGLSPGALPTTSKPYGLLFSGINIRYKIYNI